MLKIRAHAFAAQPIDAFDDNFCPSCGKLKTGVLWQVLNHPCAAFRRSRTCFGAAAPNAIYLPLRPARRKAPAKAPRWTAAIQIRQPSSRDSPLASTNERAGYHIDEERRKLLRKSPFPDHLALRLRLNRRGALPLYQAMRK